MFTQIYAKNYFLNKVNYSGHRNSINIVAELINPRQQIFFKIFGKILCSQYFHNTSQ